jgi:rhodanese-related sulfurtransferase
MIRPVNEVVAEAKKACRGVSPEEAAAMVRADDNVLVLDVREPAEADEARLSVSVNVPRGVLEMKIEDLAAEAERPILIHCARGARAALAARALREMGYRNVSFIDAAFEDIARAFG